jgi:hypothetical protein
MNEDQAQQNDQERSSHENEEVQEATPNEQPQEEQNVESHEESHEDGDKTPPKANDEQVEAAYNDNPNHMNTMPAENDYNMNSIDYARGSKTGNNFHPRRTMQGRSTDREYTMKQYARLSSNWNSRFHVSPSFQNVKSHTYYKQFFDKPTRSTQGITLKPKKRLDPYVENETKSRIPAYSRLYRERDIKKEFSWVDNFAVTHSKDNQNIHHTYKEYFDKPVG